MSRLKVRYALGLWTSGVASPASLSGLRSKWWIATSNLRHGAVGQRLLLAVRRAGVNDWNEGAKRSLVTQTPPADIFNSMGVGGGSSDQEANRLFRLLHGFAFEKAS